MRRVTDLVAQAVSKLDEVHALLVRIADERSLSRPRLELSLLDRARDVADRVAQEERGEVALS